MSKKKQKKEKQKEVKKEDKEKKKSISKISKQKEVNELTLLLENFALMQKTLADVIIAFKNLEKRFEEFLNLVEKAAKKEMGLEESEEKVGKKEAKEVKKVESKEDEKGELARKLDELLEQNRIIAEGILLLEKFIKEKLESGISIEEEKKEREESEEELSL